MRDVERRAVRCFEDRLGGGPGVLASAPGRVNLIGEHTDYNGGFVLPCAIDRRVAVAIDRGEGELYSADFNQKRPLEGPPQRSWADYPRGVRWALTVSGYEVPPFRAAIAGDVPRGAGLSSSAAIECATAVALDALFGLGIERRELALLAQQAENGFVGVNSGIMDQYASLLCQAGSALFVDCRSLEAQSVPVDLASTGLSLVVCDTRVPRTLASTGYNERRATCELAARELGVAQLRDATMADLDRLHGEVRKRARHVIGENARVLDAVDALRAKDFAAFGSLMYQSHESLRDDYQVSTPELDSFVELAAAAGALGARLTGAGFGGCAIALIDWAGLNTLENEVRSGFRDHDYRVPVFYSFLPSDGAEVVLTH